MRLPFRSFLFSAGTPSCMGGVKGFFDSGCGPYIGSPVKRGGLWFIEFYTLL